MNQREIEKKYRVLVANAEDVEDFILEDLKGEVLEDQEVSIDNFWRAAGVDFVRLRANTRELTVKVSDKGSTFDRIEENVVVDDLEIARRFCTLLYGHAVELTKTFSVYSLPGGVVLSLYTVNGCEDLFFEVEGPSAASVNEVSEVFEQEFELEREQRSLYQIFFTDEETGGLDE